MWVAIFWMLWMWWWLVVGVWMREAAREVTCGRQAPVVGVVGVSVWRLRVVGGAVKEGKGGYVAVDGEDLGEEVGGVDKAGEEDKA